MYEYHSITAYHGKPTCCFHTVRDSDDRNGRSQLRYSESRAATGCEGNNGFGLGDLSYLRWRTREREGWIRERGRKRRYKVYEEWETWRTREKELDKRKKIQGALTVGDMEDKRERERERELDEREKKKIHGV